MNRHNFNERTTKPDMDALDRIVSERPITPFIQPGDRRTIAGREFEAVEVSPYKSRRTGDSQLVTWRGQCATCGKPYETKGSRSATGLPINCETHRGRRTRHSKRRRAIQNAIASAIRAIDSGNVTAARAKLADILGGDTEKAK